MADITPDQARSALDTADLARRHVSDELGLPRPYWWGLAAGWLVLGVLGDVGPAWLVTVATLAFGAGHSFIASRILDGRRRTSRLQVSRSVAGHHIPLVVIGMLVVLVAVTIGLAFALQADGVEHAATWAGLIVALIVGFGGPEMLRVLCRWTHA